MLASDPRAYPVILGATFLLSWWCVFLAWPEQACAKCGSPPYPEHGPLWSEVIDVSPTGYASELVIYPETMVLASTGPGALPFILVPVSDDIIVFGWP